MESHESGYLEGRHAASGTLIPSLILSRPMSKEIDDLILELVDNGGSARSDDDDDGIDEYGPDLYKDEEDRRRYVFNNHHLYHQSNSISL